MVVSLVLIAVVAHGHDDVRRNHRHKDSVAQPKHRRSTTATNGTNRHSFSQGYQLRTTRSFAASAAAALESRTSAAGMVHPALDIAGG